MDAISKELSNPAWWFTAVLAAIAINILSSYAKGWTDRQLARWFESRRDRSEAEREAWKKELQRMAASPSYWTWAAHNEIRCRLRGLLYIIFATVVVAIGMALIVRRPESALPVRIIGLAITSFYFYFGFMEIRHAMRIARELDASAVKKFQSEVSDEWLK